MSKKKICYIVSDIDKAVAFEWVAMGVGKNDFEISFILISPGGPCYLEEFLIERNIPVKKIHHQKKAHWFSAFFSCIATLLKWNPQIVHCHLRKATMIGLLAAKLLGIQKRIYTRHHSTFHHEFFPKAVKWDQLANALATDIVAISENVRNVLKEKEKVPSEKVHLIHHGFDMDAFSNVAEKRIEKLKEKYLPTGFNGEVLGVISRYIEWKGLFYIIDAAQDVLQKFPYAFFIFANATGPDEKKIKTYLQQKLPSENYREVKFEEDLFALYQLFTIYIHTPINNEIEAFGQTYIEALAAGIPSIFTLSGVANEFVEDRKNAMVVPFKDSSAIENAVLKLLKDHELKNRLIERGKKSVEQFRLDEFIEKLENLYGE